MLAVFVGGLGGVLLGLSGGLGALLTVPLIILCLGESPHQAILISLAFISITALIGALSRIKQNFIDWQLVCWASIGGLIMTPFAVHMGNLLSEQSIVLTFAIACLLMSVYLYRRAFHPNMGQEKPVLMLVKRQRIAPKYQLIGIGMLSAVLIDVMGVGGGLLILPLLSHVNFRSHNANIPSVFIATFLLSSLGLYSHVQATSLHLLTTLNYITGSMIGVYLSLVIKNNWRQSFLDKLLAVSFLVLSGILVYRALF